MRRLANGSSHNDLVDREPVRPTMTTYSGYNTKPFVRAGVKVFMVKKDLLNLGRITVRNSFGHELPFYDLERTICDLIRSRSHFEMQDFTFAMRRYAARTDKNLNWLMDYRRPSPRIATEKQMRSIDNRAHDLCRYMTQLVHDDKRFILLFTDYHDKI